MDGILVAVIVICSLVGVFGLCFLAVYCKFIRPPPNADIEQKVIEETASCLPKYEDCKGPFWTSDVKVRTPIIFSEHGLGSKSGTVPMTIPATFKKAVELSGDMPALRTERPVPAFNAKSNPSEPFETWKTWTWRQYYDECLLAARGMLALGAKRYDAVTIYGFNCPEWNMSQMSGAMIGVIAAGIYPSDTTDQVVYKATHSGASIACCQGSKADMFIKAYKNGDLPKIKAVVVWDGDQSLADEEIKGPDGISLIKMTWQSLLKHGEQVSADEVNKIMDDLHPADVAAFIYTSGTTGNPKAVMITHDNILFESNSARANLPDSYCASGQERILSYLPLSHVAGCMVDIIMPVYCTANYGGYVTVGFARVYDLSKGSFGDRLRCIKPTVFLGVPRVWEKVADKIQSLGASVTGFKKKLSTFCKAKGLEHAMDCQLGGSGKYPSWYKFANEKVFSLLKGNLGLEECKFAMTGAAPIRVETLKYFGSLGLQINEVYGMSECTGTTTFSNDKCHVWGSCGYALNSCQVKIFKVSDTDINDKKECPRAKDIFNATEEEQGEICFRGRHIMAGYMANPDFGQEHVDMINKKNADAIDADGWLHSGDKGCLGENGMLKITGRYKELIIGSGGENIAPVPIEDNIKKLCPAISNIMMVGDKKKYNTALITLKAKGATGEAPGTDDLDGAAYNFVPGITTISQASINAPYIDKIRQAIAQTNSYGKVCPSSASKIQKFTILARDFSVETGELTPTLKLKRSVVMKDPKYAEVLERLYEIVPGKARVNLEYIPFNKGYVVVDVASDDPVIEA